MVKLAQDFGMSDVGLRKICDRHRVPAPGRGYWAKLAAGKRVKQTRFVDVPDEALNRIVISSGVLVLPEPVRQVIATQKAERKRVAPPPLPRPAAPAPAPETVPPPVSDIHPAVRRTAQALRRCKPKDPSVDASGDGLCGVVVGRESIERAIVILDRLARSLEAKSFPLVPKGAAMSVAVGPDSAVFTLKERTRTAPHVATPEELAADARRQAQRERYWRNPIRGTDPPPYGRTYPEKDTIWTGELVIQIDGYGDQVRRTWGDGRRQRLEELVPAIVDGIEVLLAVRKASREEREEADRRRAELQRRHALARARGEREQARVVLADEVVKLTREAEALRSWLAGSDLLRDGRLDSQVGRFAAWLQDRLQAIEERLDPLAMEKELTEKKLFPSLDADEFHDPLGDPPPIRWY